MHRRKEFLVYPYDYNPFNGDRFVTFPSRRKAKKFMLKKGGAWEMHRNVHIHPRKHTDWQTSYVDVIWEYES